MPSEVVTSVLTYGKVWMMASACAVLAELILPGPAHSLLSRLRGACFWFIYIAIGTTICAFIHRAIVWAGIHPLLDLRLGDSLASPRLLTVALGCTVYPLLGLFVWDGFYYLFHRLQHACPPLWRLHSLHHRIVELNAVNDYHHVLEEVLRIPMIVLPMMLVIHVDAPRILVITVYTAISGQLTHANTRLRFGPLAYLFVEPRYHRLHHSSDERHLNRNFAGYFPIFDVIFRTAWFSHGAEPLRTGVAGQLEARSLRDYFWPRLAAPLQGVASRPALHPPEPQVLGVKT